MSKYSNKFKLEVVKYCEEQHHGYVDAAKYFNIPSETTVLQWVRRYKEKGVEGLLKNKISSYSGEFKQEVVEYMHKNHLSATETAIKFNLANHNIVLKWERIYYEEGPQALYKERRGRSKNMSSKPRKKKLSNFLGSVHKRCWSFFRKFISKKLKIISTIFDFIKINKK